VNRISELRWKDKRLRIITTHKQSSERISLRFGSGQGYEEIFNLCKKWSPEQVVLTCISNERWSFDLDKDTVVKKLKRWRNRAEKDGFVDVLIIRHSY